MEEIQPARVLLLEDDPIRCQWFAGRLRGIKCDVTCDTALAIEWLTQRSYRLILLDHDLIEDHYFSNEHDDQRTGYAVAYWLAANPERQLEASIVIHSLNPYGAARMLEVLRKAGRQVEHIPFTDLQLVFNGSAG